MTELAVEECDFSFDDPDTGSLELDDVNITHCDTPPPIVEFEDDFVIWRITVLVQILVPSLPLAHKIMKVCEINSV